MRAILIGVLIAGLAAATSGCVTTTEGAVERPKPTSEDAAESLYSLGAQYYKNGEYDLARDRLQQALEFQGDKAQAWVALALTYEALGNEHLADDAYRSAVRSAPRDFDVLNAYAVYLCKGGENKEARRYFDRAIGAPTNDYAEITMTNAGVCMAQADEYDAAEKYLREALDRNRNYAEALLQMSRLKLETEEYLSARAFIQRYFAVAEPSALALATGWEVESKLGDERARDEYFAALMEDFPDSLEARQIASRN